MIAVVIVDMVGNGVIDCMPHRQMQTCLQILIPVSTPGLLRRLLWWSLDWHSVVVPVIIPGAGHHAGEGIVVALLIEQAVTLDSPVVEHGTEAGLPFGPTDHAELSTAAAGHVVAADLELDGRFAIVAILPALFFGNLLEGFRCGVFGACFGSVPSSVAGGAHARFALRAGAVG